MIARVVVTLKPVVNDPQGLTVRKALHHLGFNDVEDVRIGKFIELNLAQDDEAAAGEAVERMCRELLANDVIEDYRFELTRSETPAPA